MDKNFDFDTYLFISPNKIIISIYNKKSFETIYKKEKSFNNAANNLPYEKFDEFLNDNIILIDEIHTCDSSRYWIKNTYENKFKNDIEPDKLDKDKIRDWVKNKCNPYTDKIPKIPEELKKNTINSYTQFYEKIINTN